MSKDPKHVTVRTPMHEALEAHAAVLEAQEALRGALADYDAKRAAAIEHAAHHLKGIPGFTGKVPASEAPALGGELGMLMPEGDSHDLAEHLMRALESGHVKKLRGERVMPALNVWISNPAGLQGGPLVCPNCETTIHSKDVPPPLGTVGRDDPAA